MDERKAAEKTQAIVDKLTPEERKKFEDALADMLRYVDQAPALSARHCLLQCLPAPDCLVEIRSSRYLTAAEWEGVAKHLDILRATQQRQPAKKSTAKPKKRKPS